MSDFLLKNFVLSWPAFVVGLVIGAFASCRSFSSVVEVTVLIGAATVIVLTQVWEHVLLRRNRKELEAMMAQLDDKLIEKIHERVRP